MLKKRFSQNLIKDGNILRKMVALAQISQDETVVEIGAGRGDLTSAIARAARRVIAVEFDRDMIPYLETLASKDPAEGGFANIEIVAGDIMTVDIAQFSEGRTIKVMGNIPYGITGPIIFKLINEREYIESAHLTVQKEIGDRIAAKPGTREYGSLSVVCQLVSNVKVLMRLKPQVFIPPPKVESVYLSMHFKEDTGYIDEDFLSFVRRTFAHKRKFMRNSLRERYTEHQIEALYEKMSFSRSVRAEEIGPEIYPLMYQVIAKEDRNP